VDEDEAKTTLFVPASREPEQNAAQRLPLQGVSDVPSTVRANRGAEHLDASTTEQVLRMGRGGRRGRVRVDVRAFRAA